MKKSWRNCYVTHHEHCYRKHFCNCRSQSMKIGKHWAFESDVSMSFAHILLACLICISIYNARIYLNLSRHLIKVRWSHLGKCYAICIESVFGECTYWHPFEAVFAKWKRRRCVHYKRKWNYGVVPYGKQYNRPSLVRGVDIILIGAHERALALLSVSFTIRFCR